MPTPTIVRGSDHFFTTLYEGNGGGIRAGKFLPFTDNGTIGKSLFFNDADNAFLQRTNDAGDRDTFTVSVWVKRGYLSGAIQHIFDVYDGSSSNDGYIRFNADNTISTRIGSPSNHLYTTNRKFEDTSKWYHIVLSVNTGDSTADDRVKLYVDGDLITSYSSRTNPGQGDNTQFNYDSATFYIGKVSGGSYDYDGYIAEFNLVDGTALTPSTFGLTDTSTGRWIPKTLTGITYGTNGHRLEFANSAGQTIGDDTSGNTNDFAVTNSVAADVTLDTPSDLYPTMQDIQTSYAGVYSEGNLRIDGSTNSQTSVGRSTLTFDVEDSTGYYCEIKNIENNGFGTNWNGYGLFGVDADNSTPSSGNLKPASGSHVTYRESGNIVVKLGASGSEFDGGTAYFPKTGNNSSLPSGGDTIGIAIKSGKVWFAKNGNWINPKQGHPGLDGTPAANNISGRFRIVSMCYHSTSAQEVNFGQRLTLGGTATSDYTANNGGRFVYNPPVGFRAIKQDNLDTTHKSIPDMVWVKNRDSGSWYHTITDSSRGVLQEIYPNDTSDQAFQANSLRKFLKGGFQCGEAGNWNLSGSSMVGWNWVANNASTGSSTNSTIQTNSTANFSIVTYNGTGSDQNIGHGLGVKPDTIWVKNTLENSATGTGVSWRIWQKDAISLSSDPNTYLRFDSDDSHTAGGDSWGDTAPTTSVFTVGADVHTNASVSGGTATYVAYCFANLDGFFKTGSYAGSGDAEGTYVYLGFKPAFLMIKAYNVGTSWHIWDTLRSPINPITNKAVFPDVANAEGGTHTLDLLANGFKLRSTENWVNNASYTYLYWAFAEHPFIGDGTNPAVAR